MFTTWSLESTVGVLRYGKGSPGNQDPMDSTRFLEGRKSATLGGMTYEAGEVGILCHGFLLIP